MARRSKPRVATLARRRVSGAIKLSVLSGSAGRTTLLGGEGSRSSVSWGNSGDLRLRKRFFRICPLHGLTEGREQFTARRSL